MKRVSVVSRAAAVEIAQAAVVSRSDICRIVVLADEVLELWWAWVVPIQSADYAATRDPKDALLGLGPYLIDKFTREAIPTGTGTRIHPLERQRGYRSWWDFRGPNRVMQIPRR